MRRLGFFFAALVGVAPQLAHASAATDALEKSGLIGRWSPNCAQPASTGNYIVTWSATADGVVTQLVDQDRPKPEPAKRLFNLTRAPDGKIAYAIPLETGTLAVELLVEENRYRLWSSSLSGYDPGVGEVFVKNGKYPTSGNPSTWILRCG